MFKTRKNTINLQTGMTLVELLVVLAIFVIISGIVMFNYSRYRSIVSVENLAQDIALTVRKAQVFALGVKGSQINGGQTEFTGYGIHFYIPSTTGFASSGSEKSFIFFSDIPPVPGAIGNLVYDQYSPVCTPLIYQNECMDIINITSTDRVSELCLDTTCSNSISSPSLDIVFNRPNSNAIFCFRLNGSSCSNGSSAKIKIKSENDHEKIITVWNTGQIYVQ